MQESRAQRDISVSKQRPTQSRSVGLSISDAVDAHRFRPLEADYPSCWSRKTCKPHALAQWRGRSAVVVGGGPSKGPRGSAALPIPDSRSAAKRLRGRDASYLAPPAQIRTCGFPAYGSHLGCQRRKRAVCEPTPVTRWSGTESSTCFTSPHSPRSLPFAPPTPPRIAPFCSSASQLL